MPNQHHQNFQPYDNRPPPPPQTHGNYSGYTPASGGSNMMHNYPPHPSSYQNNAYYGASSMQPNNYANNAPYTPNNPNAYGHPQQRHPYNNVPHASDQVVSPRNDQIRQQYNSNPNVPPQGNPKGFRHCPTRASSSEQANGT